MYHPVQREDERVQECCESTTCVTGNDARGCRVKTYCLLLWAMCLALLALVGALVATLVATNQDPVKVDVSGSGFCKDNTVQVYQAWEWTQYPATPEKKLITDHTRLKEYIGRNAIVWNAQRSSTARVSDVDDRGVVTVDLLTHGITDDCEFTLDSIPVSPSSPPPPSPPPPAPCTVQSCLQVGGYGSGVICWNGKCTDDGGCRDYYCSQYISCTTSNSPDATPSCSNSADDNSPCSACGNSFDCEAVCSDNSPS